MLKTDHPDDVVVKALRVAYGVLGDCHPNRFTRPRQKRIEEAKRLIDRAIDERFACLAAIVETCRLVEINALKFNG